MSRRSQTVAAFAALALAAIASFAADAATSGATRTAAAAPGAGLQPPLQQENKPPGEFKAWLVNTDDGSWQRRWFAPFAEVPDVKPASSAKRGQHIYTLIFMTNPMLDVKDEANVRCDLRVTAPDGSRPVQTTDMDCLQGRLNGDPAQVWLSRQVLEFVSEPADPVGTWSVDVTLRDTLSNVTLNLHTSFEVLQGS